MSPEIPLARASAGSGRRSGPWLGRGAAARPDRLFWALVLVVLGGAALRFIGIDWGLPLQLHPDEGVIVRGAIDMAQRNSFEPPYFLRPDHVEMKLSYLAYVAYAYLVHGVPPEVVYASAPAPFLLLSRAITAALGVVMIVVAFLIGRRLNRVIGVMAAFFVAFFPPFVEHAHYATPDVPLTLALMIVVLGCMRYVESPSWGNLLVASLGVSVAVAIKYPGALGALMIAITVVVSASRARSWRRLIGHGSGAVAAVVGFLFLISPVLFTNIHGVVAAITAEARDTHLGADGLGWSGNLAFYAEVFATRTGVVVLGFVVLGVLWSIRLRLVATITLWLGAVFWVVLSAMPLHWERWGLPMHVTPLLLAPIGIYYTFRYLRDRDLPRWVLGGAVALAVLMAASLVIGSTATAARFVATDTREAAAETLAGYGVDRDNAAYEGYTPLLPGAPRTIFDAVAVVDGQLVVTADDGADPTIRYVVLSSDMYDRFMADPKYATVQQVYAALDEQGTLLATVEPVPHGRTTLLEAVNLGRSLRYVAQVADGGLSGPTIKLYEIPADRR